MLRIARETRFGQGLIRPLLAVLILLAALTAPPLSGPASAQDLDQLRAAGLVGERFDGYAEAIDQSYLEFVRQVNGKRHQIYSARAAEQGVAVDQVGRVYASQIIQQSPSGTQLLKEDGTWATKP